MADELENREDRELDAIHRQMAQTRAKLGDKLEKLEAHVTGTVAAATETVSDAVQGVKDVVGTVTESVATVASTVTETAASVSGTVSDTVAAVAETFNIPKQIEAHPWGAVGAAFGLGFLGSFLFGSSKHKEPAHSPVVSSAIPSLTPVPAEKPKPEPARQEEPSAVGKLLNQATEGVTDLALNAIMNTVRNLTASLPENFRDPANQFVDNMAKDLGVSPKVIAENPPISKPLNGAGNGASHKSRQPETDIPAKVRERSRMAI
jgi:ElaB/YqjD/DUF883 family membrane-anchored ribosome-binding protein